MGDGILTQSSRDAEVEVGVEPEVKVKVERSGICVVNKNKREMVLQSIPI